MELKADEINDKIKWHKVVSKIQNFVEKRLQSTNTERSFSKYLNFTKNQNRQYMGRRSFQ